MSTPGETPKPESDPNPDIQGIVDEIYADCRKHREAYDSPSGIKLKVGDVDWAVVYWPASTRNDEKLNLVRDWQKLKDPVTYRILQTGFVTKNDKIADRLKGGVFWDPTGEVPVDDVDEVLTLQAIVMAAHNNTS